LFRGTGCGAAYGLDEAGDTVSLARELDDGAVKHAIELSEEKYCSVAAMLKKTAKVSWRYEIVRSEACDEAP